jgi:hypothetical protein
MPGDYSLEELERVRPALEAAFYQWWAENDHALVNGHAGDVVHLFAALSAAAMKASVTSLVSPSAC